jgi:hypothetical protein
MISRWPARFAAWSAVLADFINDCNDGINHPAQIICYRRNVHR